MTLWHYEAEHAWISGLPAPTLPAPITMSACLAIHAHELLQRGHTQWPKLSLAKALLANSCYLPCIIQLTDSPNNTAHHPRYSSGHYLNFSSSTSECALFWNCTNSWRCLKHTLWSSYQLYINEVIIGGFVMMPISRASFVYFRRSECDWLTDTQNDYCNLLLCMHERRLIIGHAQQGC